MLIDRSARFVGGHLSAPWERGRRISRHMMSLGGKLARGGAAVFVTSFAGAWWYRPIQDRSASTRKKGICAYVAYVARMCHLYRFQHYVYPHMASQ